MTLKPVDRRSNQEAMRVALVALFAWAGCTPELPDPLNEEVAAPAFADEAQAFVVDAWSSFLGVGLEEPPLVRWFGVAPDGSRCLKYEDYLVGLDVCVGGATPMVTGGGPYEIHLIPYGERASASGLAHEHLHWALDQLGRTDGDHSSPAWDHVHAVEDELAAAGF